MAKQYNFYNLQFPPIFEHYAMYRVVMISTKDATNVSPSYMTALATEKKNMYYTRMLLARCNNALMSGIIDSFFYVKSTCGGGEKIDAA